VTDDLYMCDDVISLSNLSNLIMWKNFTKEQLDAAYNNSKAVANSAEIIQAWQPSGIEIKIVDFYK